ncbi:helix-turn-helix domain-containing protein [Altererythrobacter salegens]|uniref:Helix-turn-helix domain-containing protein n=1 Tax=Croceibacterium salegens TaxID=1737568 RepID=A0A6I4T104_9SPHN|nr:Crp/Fnr family transcriptional regulator [Croceibacterium salegens]MXO60342.1 helix-turn-helix domain-containing protein [Croceibacterium salegens]
MTTPSLLHPQSWLSDQPDAFAAALHEIGVTKDLSAGTPLYMSEETGGIFGILQGCIEIDIAFACSPLSALHFAYPGYFLGTRPFTTGVGYAVSTKARLDSQVVEFRLQDLHVLVAKNPEWWKPLSNLTSYWFDVATCSAVDLLLRDPEVRCIAVLLRLGGYRPFEHIDAQPRTIPVTHNELAENSNLSRSRLSETLANLEAAGHIRRGYRDIEVLRPASLARMIEFG